MYFLSFSTKSWKNGRREAIKFRTPAKTLGKKEEDRQKIFICPGKNSGNVGRMEEAVKQENNLKLYRMWTMLD